MMDSMYASNFLLALIKCIISLRLGLEPLSWMVTITESTSYIGIFTMSGSELPIRLRLLLLEVDANMSI